MFDGNILHDKRRRFCSCETAVVVAAAAQVVGASAAAPSPTTGRWRRFSKRAGRAWNSLKMALAPALLGTVVNFVMALCEILSIMLVACCCCHCSGDGSGGGGTKSNATQFNC